MAFQLRALLRDCGSVSKSISDASQIPVTLAPGNPKPSSGLCGYYIHIVYIETHRLTHIHRNKKNIFKCTASNTTKH